MEMKTEHSRAVLACWNAIEDAMFHGSLEHRSNPAQAVGTTNSIAITDRQRLQNHSTERRAVESLFGRAGNWPHELTGILTHFQGKI